MNLVSFWGCEPVRKSITKEENEKYQMDGSMEMKGMERHSLHLTAYNIIHHSEIIRDEDLLKEAKDYLKRMFKKPYDR